MKANVLNFGAIGSGKSYSVRTALREWPDKQGKMHEGAGKDVFVLALEPGAEASHDGLTCEMGFHRKTLLPAGEDWEATRKFVEQLGRLDNTEDIVKIRIPLDVRQAYQQYLDLYEIRANFVCEVCDNEFGRVQNWSEDRVFVNDGLSGLTQIATHYINGPRPFLALALYQPVMGLIRSYVNECLSIKASYILIAHWDREVNEVTREKTITIDTIGQKLAPRLLKGFDELMISHFSPEDRKGQFWWSTIEDGVELKCRRLPYSSRIEPDYRQIFK